MSRIIDRRPKAKATCKSCGFEHIIPMEKYTVGDVLQPFAGGGTYGQCLKCKRPGLVVSEIPKTPILKPVGWTKIPGI